MTGISAARARAILEEYRDFRLAHLSGGDPQDQLGELVRIGFDRFGCRIYATGNDTRENILNIVGSSRLLKSLLEIA